RVPPLAQEVPELLRGAQVTREAQAQPDDGQRGPYLPFQLPDPGLLTAGQLELFLHESAQLGGVRRHVLHSSPARSARTARISSSIDSSVRSSSTPSGPSGTGSGSPPPPSSHP